MLEGALTVALAEIRERNAKVTIAAPLTATASADDIPRLLAAVEALLKLHQRQERPVLSWDRACPAHRDKHGFADPRQREARDCPHCRFSEFYVCSHCSCPNDRWPCPTAQAIAGVMTRKEDLGA